MNLFEELKWRGLIHSVTDEAVIEKINNGEVTTVYGGGDQGYTLGEIEIAILDGTITTIYSGANQADVTGNVNLTIDNCNITVNLPWIICEVAYNKFNKRFYKNANCFEVREEVVWHQVSIDVPTSVRTQS